MLTRTLAAIPLAAVLALGIAGCDTGTSPLPSPTPTQTQPAEPGSLQRPHPLGTEIEGDGWEVVVNSVVVDASEAIAAANEFNPAPPDGQQYLTVNVTLTRAAPQAGYPFDVEFGYVTADGRTLRESEAVAPERIDLLTELQPDAELTGNIVFLVPSDTADRGVLSVIPGDREARAYVALR